jgi:acetyl esterase
MDSHTGVNRSAHRHARLRPTLAALAALLLALTLCASASGATRATAELPVLESLSYGPSAAEVANVYPAGAAGAPLVVLVHGGGWRKQGPLGRLELEAHSLQREGSAVVEINYDQDSATTVAFPIEPEEVATATRWAIANAPSFNADPHTVVLVGGSAGGNLVALAAEQLDAASPGTVDGVVTLSAPTDFPALLPMLGPDTLYNESFTKSVHQALGMGGEPALRAAASTLATEFSPALHAPKSGCPSWLIVNSEAEFVPLPQAQELYGNLRAAGCNARLIVLPGREHAFGYFHSVKPAVFSFIASL